MTLRLVATLVAIAGVVVSHPVGAQIPGLNAGTVTATIDGAPFSGNVSIATFKDGTLILTSLSNVIQIQVPDAAPGTFELSLDDDGEPVGVLVGLKVGNRYVTPVVGSLTIESLSSTAAAGRFEFRGRDLETDAVVRVTDGRFQVTLSGGA